MKCIYCGEEEATERIANPNLDMGDEIDWFDEKNWWKVCKDCKDVIHYQRESSFGIAIEDEDMVNRANKELEKIANRTGKPILNACIFKKKEGGYGSASIEFTGE